MISYSTFYGNETYKAYTFKSNSINHPGPLNRLMYIGYKFNVEVWTLKRVSVGTKINNINKFGIAFILSLFTLIDLLCLMTSRDESLFFIIIENLTLSMLSVTASIH